MRAACKAIILGLMGGCAAAPVEMVYFPKDRAPEYQLVWPGPPETPRLAYAGELIGETVKQFDLRDRISAVGLDHSVGVAGARLTTVQRQKLALGRALLKRPKLLILNQATAAPNSSGKEAKSFRDRQ